MHPKKNMPMAHPGHPSPHKPAHPAPNAHPKPPAHPGHPAPHKPAAHPAPHARPAPHSQPAPAPHAPQSARSTQAPYCPAKKEVGGNTGKTHQYTKPACRLDNIDVWCKHEIKPDHAAGEEHGTHTHMVAPPLLGGRDNRHAKIRPDRKLIIEVIPDGVTLKTGTLGGGLEIGTNIATDLISFKANVLSPDSHHPVWTITGPDIPQTQHYGNTLDLKVRSPGFSTDRPNLLGFYWKPEIEPWEYRVKCEACQGAPQETLIRVWPFFKSELEILSGVNPEDEAAKPGESASRYKSPFKQSSKSRSNDWGDHLSQFRKSVAGVLSVLTAWIPNVDHIQCTMLEGQLKLSNCLKEEADYMVTWEGELSLEMVIFGLEVQIKLAHVNWFPEKVQKIFEEFGVEFEAQVYFKIKGETKAQIKAVWAGEKGGEIEGEGSGSISLSVGVDIHAELANNLLAADLHATTTGTLKGKPHKVTNSNGAKGVILENSFEWNPLTVAGSLKFKRKNVWMVGDVEKNLLNVEIKLFDNITVPCKTLQLWPI